MKNFFSSVLLLTSLALASCSPHQPTQRPVNACVFSPQKKQLKDYEITVPKSWDVDKTKIVNDETGVTRELIAAADAMLGQIPPIVTVITVPLVNATPEDFAAGMVLTIVQQHLKVIKTNVVKIDNQLATLIAYMSEENLLVLQLNIASKNKGYVIACAGDPNFGHELIETCSEIINSFRIIK